MDQNYFSRVRRLLLFTLLSAAIALIPSKPAVAQNLPQTATGRVVCEDGSPIVGASVVVVGTNRGTTSGLNGEFSLDVSPDELVQVSFLGYGTKELPAASLNHATITLVEEGVQISELVVTALGVKKDKQKLGYSTQEVKGSAFEKAREPDFVGSLTGKVAGLTVINRNSFFERPEMTLRGGSALLVVDGVPVNSDTYSLSPDDIESVNVLKGTAAATLYGAQGINGAIMITTKKGGSGDEGIEVSFNSSNQFQAGFLRFPETQQSYGMGWAGQYSFKDGMGGGVYDNYGYVWGPKLNVKDPSTASGWREICQYDSPIDPLTGERIPTPYVTRGKNNLKDFLQTEVLTTNNISISSKYDRGSFRISLSDTYQRGQVPTTHMNSFSIALSGEMQVNKRMKVGGNIMYNMIKSPNYPTVSYSSDHYVYNIALWMGPDLNINSLRNYWAPGQEGVQQTNYNLSWYNNPWFQAYEKKNVYDSGSVVSQAYLNYDITSRLSVMLRSGLSSNNIQTETKTPWSYIGALQGAYSVTHQRTLSSITDLLFTYENQWGDFGLTASLGGTINYSKYSALNSNTSGGLTIPGLYTLSNSVGQITSNSELAEAQTNSLMGTVELSYRNIAYLNFSGRNDWSSKLQAPNNSYFYPSVSLSLVVSNLFHAPDWLTYLKLRGAFAQISSDYLSIEGVRSEYATQPVYLNGIRWNGNPSLYLPDVLIRPDLKPNKTISQEYGVDVRFLQNRLGIDATYYVYKDVDKIIQVDIPRATGYTSELVNGDKVKRSGIEVVLTGTPVRTKDWEWNLTANYNRFRQIQEEFYGGAERRGLIAVGDRTDVIVGKKFDMTDDGRTVYSGGFPQDIPGNPNTVLGHLNPDWEFSIYSSLRFRNFTLGFQIDGRVGGQVINGLEKKMYEGGNHVNTANSYRDDAYQGLATYVGDGVVVTGGEVEYDSFGNKIRDTRTFAPNTEKVNYIDWIFANYAKEAVPSDMIQDATFVKLRELTLTYNLPQSLLKGTFIKGASISFVGRNLFIITKVPYMDPDGGSYLGRSGSLENSFYALSDPSYRNIGFNVSLKF